MVDEQALTSILDRVLSILQFAEAKNGVLAVLASTWAVWCLTTYVEAQSGPFHSFLMPISGGLGLIAAGFAVWSFRPVLKYQGDKISEIDTSNNLNCIYFGDLQKYRYEQLLCVYGYKAQSDTPKLITDLVQQIVVTSEISFSKFIYFNKGLIFLTISGALALATIVWETFANAIVS